MITHSDFSYGLYLFHVRPFYEGSHILFYRAELRPELHHIGDVTAMIAHFGDGKTPLEAIADLIKTLTEAEVDVRKR